MSLLLLPADPGPCGLELLNVGLLGRPLICPGMILIIELCNELRGRGIFTEKFFSPNPCRHSVSNW